MPAEIHTWISAFAHWCPGSVPNNVTPAKAGAYAESRLCWADRKKAWSFRHFHGNFAKHPIRRMDSHFRGNDESGVDRKTSPCFGRMWQTPVFYYGIGLRRIFPGHQCAFAETANLVTIGEQVHAPEECRACPERFPPAHARAARTACSSSPLTPMTTSRVARASPGFQGRSNQLSTRGPVACTTSRAGLPLSAAKPFSRRIS